MPLMTQPLDTRLWWGGRGANHDGRPLLKARAKFPSPVVEIEFQHDLYHARLGVFSGVPPEPVPESTIPIARPRPCGQGVRAARHRLDTDEFWTD